MANISSYPSKTPKLGDIIIFSETYDVNAANPVVGNPTKSTSLSGVKSIVQSTLPGILEYDDNADALAGGLNIGERYRTGDLLKIVH